MHGILRTLLKVLLISVSVPLLACGGYEEHPSGLKFRDEVVGSGESPEAGDYVTVHYTGRLYDSGAKFDSSLDRDRPFTFQIGRGQVIQGWDIGVMSMKKGGKRILVIPPDLGYGERGAGPRIPPNSTLKFDVELLDFRKPPEPWPTPETAARRAAGGLQYYVLSEGEGERPQAGQTVAVHYSGYLEDGTLFDSSRTRGEPIEFVLGQGQVIKGWDAGIALMKPGAKYKLVIPPNLGYGDQGAGRVIPPNATLIFDVELVEVK